MSEKNVRKKCQKKMYEKFKMKNEKSKFLEGRNLQKEERKKIWRKKLTKQNNFFAAKKHKNHT